MKITIIIACVLITNLLGITSFALNAATAAESGDNQGEKITLLKSLHDAIILIPPGVIVTTIMTFYVVPIISNVRLRNRINNMFSGVKIAKGRRKNSIMMLGLGDTGKSTLSRRLCGDMDKKPSTETEKFRVFKGKTTINTHKIDLYISDYRGQNVGTLISGFVQQQLQERSPFRFGYVNTLILIVDITGPEKELKDTPVDEHPRIEKINQARVKEHISQWNRTALDAIFGLHTVNSLRYVCLFVNKKDRLRKWDNSTQVQIEKLFETLIADLKRRCLTIGDDGKSKEYAIFDFIIGSAAQEIPVKLLNNLQELSAPMRKDFSNIRSEIIQDRTQ